MVVRGLGLVLLALLARAADAAAQGVLVAPHAVYLDHRTRSAAITLYNPGAEPAEVSISSVYGYPVTDSLGHFTLFLPDSVEPGMPAATGWVEAFPRRMTIAPLERQTVRLLARPPQGLADGEYWSRVVISAQGGTVPVSGAADSSGITIGLNLEIRTIIPLIYRKGPLTTALAVQSLSAAPAGDSLQVRAHLSRQGSGAWIGTVRGALRAPDGKMAARFDLPLAIYYDADPVLSLPVAGLAAGPYQLFLEFLTERSDLMPEQILRAPVVRDSLAIRLP